MKFLQHNFIKRYLVSTTFLAGLSGLFVSGASTAEAACQPTISANGQTVTCTGSDTTGVASGAFTNTTVVVQDGATIAPASGTKGIDLNAPANVTLNGSGNVTSQGNNTEAIKIFVGSGASVTLNDTSSVATSGTSSRGIYVNAGAAAGASTITLNGQSSVHTTGQFGFGAQLVANSGAATMSNDAAIVTSGQGAIGLAVVDDNNIITLNNNATIETGGSSANGIQTNGSNNLISLNDHASIVTTGTLASAILLFAGTTNAVHLQAGTSVLTTGANAAGIDFSLANGAGTLNNAGSIVTQHSTAVTGDPTHAMSITNSGLIESVSGAAIALGSAADVVTLDTGSRIIGTVDGGGGNDVLNLQGQGSAGNLFSHFETLNVAGTDWSLSANDGFATTININSGRLGVNGTITAPTTTIANTGTLGGDGFLVSDVTDNGGHIAPGNSPGTLTINGTLQQNGGAFDIQYDASALDRLNVTGAVTLTGGPAVNVTPLGGAGGASGIIIHSDTSITGAIGPLNYQGNGAASLQQTGTDISLITADGSLNTGSAFAASETGLDMLDTIADEQLAGLVDCSTDSCDAIDPAHRHIWAKGFGRFGKEGAVDGNQPFDYRIAGGGVGADFPVAEGLRLGVAALYGNTEETLRDDAGTGDIDTALAALYANYQYGRFFLTGAISGGWQNLDLSRSVVTNGGMESADASPDGWLLGTTWNMGMRFAFPDDWHLTPSLGASYQHQWVGGYQEHGAGAGDISVARQQADALRLRARLELARDYHLDVATLTPSLSIGVRQQYHFGGSGDAALSDGTDFTIDLLQENRTVGLVGLGLQARFNNGLATYVDYDGALAAGRTVHAVTAGLRYTW
jgi:hypothetical protein